MKFNWKKKILVLMVVILGLSLVPFSGVGASFKPLANERQVKSLEAAIAEAAVGDDFKDRGGNITSVEYGNGGMYTDANGKEVRVTRICLKKESDHYKLMHFKATGSFDIYKEVDGEKYNFEFVDGEVRMRTESKKNIVEEIKGEAGDAMGEIILTAISMFIIGPLHQLVGMFLSYLMIFMDFLLGASNVLYNSGVENGWRAIRDLCNMFFIFVLLAIAVMTVFFGSEGSSYSIKKALPMLIIAVLTINFSLLMARIITEGSEVIMRNFVSKGEAGIIGDVMGINKIAPLDPNSDMTGEDGYIEVDPAKGGETIEGVLTPKE